MLNASKDYEADQGVHQGLLKSNKKDSWKDELGFVGICRKHPHWLA